VLVAVEVGVEVGGVVGVDVGEVVAVEVGVGVGGGSGGVTTGVDVGVLVGIVGGVDVGAVVGVLKIRAPVGEAASMKNTAVSKLPPEINASKGRFAWSTDSPSCPVTVRVRHTSSVSEPSGAR
jgi:hypothetical protein